MTDYQWQWFKDGLDSYRARHHPLELNVFELYHSGWWAWTVGIRQPDGSLYQSVASGKTASYDAATRAAQRWAENNRERFLPGAVTWRRS